MKKAGCNEDYDVRLGFANAALAAMREPTEAMIEEAYYSAMAENAASVWRDMIDAALKPQAAIDEALK